MKKELLKKIDQLIMDFWNSKELINSEKQACVMELEEVQMILQGVKKV